jgi:transposase InsO family protein
VTCNTSFWTGIRSTPRRFGRAYLHAVIDKFSRRILAWRLADTFAPGNSVTVLLEARQAATPSDTTPIVLADAAVENVNAQVDALIEMGVLRRLLAFTELKFSNSMIEAWWRSLRHQWLFLHSLNSSRTVRRLVAFYVDQHNRVLPHSAFRGQPPDEMYFYTAACQLQLCSDRESLSAGHTSIHRARSSERGIRQRVLRVAKRLPRKTRWLPLLYALYRWRLECRRTR